MITLVEALNFRCLRYIHQPLDKFHVLVGPNASGKTTFLDVVGFLSDFVAEGLSSALEKRSPNFVDLLFGREGKEFQMALEFVVPDNLKQKTAFAEGSLACRYEVVVGVDDETNEVVIDSESLRFRSHSARAPL